MSVRRVRDEHDFEPIRERPNKPAGKKESKIVMFSGASIAKSQGEMHNLQKNHRLTVDTDNPATQHLGKSARKAIHNVGRTSLGGPNIK